jgi:GMP synthase (glutamine-hydrolysing)
MRAGSLVILKMGSTLPSLKSRRGDFEDWIISGTGLSRAEVTVIDVPAGDPLPPPDGEAGVIVTGSNTMVTEQKDWSERTADWLRGAVSRRLPVLGVCYGHQLLAHAHGGVVGDNPKGREFGTVEIVLEGPAHADALLGSLPRRFAAHEGHTQSVLTLPTGATRLASNQWDANQAFRIGDRAWGIQFHPEFDAQIVREYVSHYRDLLSREGQDPDSLRETAEDNPHGPEILTRFAALCRRED